MHILKYQGIKKTIKINLLSFRLNKIWNKYDLIEIYLNDDFLKDLGSSRKWAQIHMFTVDTLNKPDEVLKRNI